MLGNGTAVNHSDRCQKSWEEKLINDADLRILRQAEKMYTPQEEYSSSSSSRTPPPTTTQETIPEKTTIVIGTLKKGWMILFISYIHSNSAVFISSLF